MNFKKALYIIFWGLFLIPELIWFSTSNYLIGTFRPNYFFNGFGFSDLSPDKFLLIYSIQVFGILGIATSSFLVANITKGKKRAFVLFSGLAAFILFLIAGFYLIAGLAFRNFSGL